MTVRRLELEMGVREYDHWKALVALENKERAEAQKQAKKARRG